MTTIDVHAHVYDRRYLSELTGQLTTPRTDVERASAALLALMERIGHRFRCCMTVGLQMSSPTSATNGLLADPAKPSHEFSTIYAARLWSRRRGAA